LEVHFPAPPIRNVGVQLGSSQIGMTEHFLNASEVGSSLEQVSRERVAQEMRMNSLGLEARLLGQLAEDEEGPGPRQASALGVEEELRAVAPVEVRPAACEVTPECLHGLPTDGDDPLLPALADRPDETLIEVDAGLVEADRLAHAEPRSVEQLDERAVAE
jgi:hypothetical protein